MGASVVVRISDGTTRPPQYEIENASAAAIMVQQRDYPGQRAHLGAGQSMPFVWTAVADKRVLDVWLSAPMVHARVLLDKVNSECTVDWAGIPISLFVVARGAARILVVAPKIEEIAATALPSLRFEAQVCGVGLSLVRSGVQELAYMRLSGLGISVMLEPTVHTFKLTVENMRLDNQTKVAQLPAVVIRSSYVTRHRNIVGDEVDAREQRKLHSLELAVVRDKLDHSGHSFRSFNGQHGGNRRPRHMIDTVAAASIDPKASAMMPAPRSSPHLSCLKNFSNSLARTCVTMLNWCR